MRKMPKRMRTSSSFLVIGDKNRLGVLRKALGVMLLRARTYWFNVYTLPT
jgi:hypothetical protein